MNEEVITDVNASVWKTFMSYRKRYTKVFLIGVLANVLLVFCLKSLVSLAISAVLLVCVYAYLWSEAHKRFMQQFAKLNNLDYQDTPVAPENLLGSIFQAGSSRSKTNVVSGQYLDFPMRLFNYTYVTGSGKHRRVHRFTVCEMTFRAKLPSIKLVANSYVPDWILGRTLVVAGARITLEEDFENKFSLFVPHGYETEALQIFTKDFLTLLLSDAPDYSIELVGDKLYIYDDRLIANKVELDTLYDVLKRVIKQLGPLLGRLADDFDALRPYYG
jgi:hypothetical protein